MILSDRLDLVTVKRPRDRRKTRARGNSVESRKLLVACNLKDFLQVSISSLFSSIIFLNGKLFSDQKFALSVFSKAGVTKWVS